MVTRRCDRRLCATLRRSAVNIEVVSFYSRPTIGAGNDFRAAGSEAQNGAVGRVDRIRQIRVFLEIGGEEGADG